MKLAVTRCDAAGDGLLQSSNAELLLGDLENLGGGVGRGARESMIATSSAAEEGPRGNADLADTAQREAEVGASKVGQRPATVSTQA
jgi:hypothetical protein